MAISDEQRAYITLQLQRNYGNKYVQRVVERNREKEGSLKSLKTKTDPGIETVSRQGVERLPIFAEISSTMPEIQRMEEQKEPTHEEEQPTNEPTLESAIALLRYTS
jgi:hypothetical protein